MLDDDLAKLRAHQSNVRRYRRLLGTQLSEVELRFIEKRLGEEEAAMENLKAGIFPLAFAAGKQQHDVSANCIRPVPRSGTNAGRRTLV